MLTPRQSEYLAFIRSYAAQYGRVPSGYKVADNFGVSYGASYRMLETLCSLGHIHRIFEGLGSNDEARFELPETPEDFELPQGLQVALLQASERAAMKPKLLLAQIVREWCERDAD